MTTKIAINGFGRIGRNVLRAMLKRDMLKAGSDLEIVALNDLTSPETLAHLLQYDSVHGELPYEVTVSDKAIAVNGVEIKVCAETDPAKLPWKELGVDIVVESTGRFTKGPDAAKHIQAGAKKVIISAPGKDIDATIVMGVNDHTYDAANHHVVSNASCTTNCLAPFAKVLHEQFGIVRGLMTTVHAYTNDQRILDLPHSDLRRARAAGQSIIPTTTGAAKAVALVLPELKGKLNGFAMRVPTPNVSVVDLVAELEKPATEEAINSALKAAAEGPLKGILAFCEKPLVSRDFNGNPHSSIVDAPSTMVLDGKMAKVVAWYDNEWGYSNRVVDLALLMAAKGL
ncbi:glyceraldehyde-3-phosphate dehydrogenase [Heliomicrobium modesticaldum Ice1]|uniref:Glyceraldehyde-3-phosphate dehydrogenase n=1 Tax=Heliobacterium modesticaldum (strain ATCC 51547 / Ice1) TaxID=498761 RepID=B0TDD1_HELMI|nr:type I glyceraldehyde-3-phosphate dehydrogenase [Heliomicrobium modesticaldum]ABZ84172.1 glyceraldehyde-3-phosphate dehydrogenase [Heliomicrobium modesticaldum Ice1]